MMSYLLLRPSLAQRNLSVSLKFHLSTKYFKILFFFLYLLLKTHKIAKSNTKMSLNYKITSKNPFITNFHSKSLKQTLINSVVFLISNLMLFFSHSKKSIYEPLLCSSKLPRVFSFQSFLKIVKIKCKDETWKVIENYLVFFESTIENVISKKFILLDRIIFFLLFLEFIAKIYLWTISTLEIKTFSRKKIHFWKWRIEIQW